MNSTELEPDQRLLMTIRLEQLPQSKRTLFGNASIINTVSRTATWTDKTHDSHSVAQAHADVHFLCANLPERQSGAPRSTSDKIILQCRHPIIEHAWDQSASPPQERHRDHRMPLILSTRTNAQRRPLSAQPVHLRVDPNAPATEIRGLHQVARAMSNHRRIWTMRSEPYCRAKVS